MAKSRTGSRYLVREVKASEFKAKCLSVMDEVRERGIQVVITKRGKPVAKLVPVKQRAHSPIGFMRGTVIAQEDLVFPDHEAWALDGEDRE